jgi:AraC-like DNA-binding protein
MQKSETLEEFYKRKYDWMPESLRNEIGHFNLFPLKPIPKGTQPSIPYRRRDYYKVMLVKGGVVFHYADRKVEVGNQALVFSNPRIPYKVERLDLIEGGCYCIFNDHFFHQFGQIDQYAVFQPNGEHVFELSNEQSDKVEAVYSKMIKEFDSDYIHKYDVLRNHVFELLHFAMKLHPNTNTQKYASTNASQRISSLFFELLERQFPIEESHPQIQLRSASDFADQLNVHVNHLNRAIKETTEKTTSQIIAERIIQEAKVLLKHSHWNISAIAFALGFKEVTHFNNFFKKHLQTSPSKFRKG